MARTSVADWATGYKRHHTVGALIADLKLKSDREAALDIVQRLDRLPLEFWPGLRDVSYINGLQQSLHDIVVKPQSHVNARGRENLKMIRREIGEREGRAKQAGALPT